MADANVTPRPGSNHIKRNRRCDPNREINILLLGQTGVGKTTFINSFANYLVNDTLSEAINDEIQVLIPSSFSYTNPETFEEKLIKIGEKDNREKINENGESCTQQCRSFVFPIGDRNLRLIDTPGMGDTRGSEQDNKNLFEILTYISHYEHLNGICIFLKPNEERLTISFRLCIKQILHYLHSSARENIVFIFTNARATFFMPGTSKKLLQTLLIEYRDKNDLEIPFSKDNSFLLDNESFRYLILHKNGIQIDDEQSEIYKKSWDYTEKEYERLIDYISRCSLHAVANTLSLNEAEQLIRKLPRPIAETLRLIQQNIQLANEYKQELLKNQRNMSHPLYQNTVQIIPLQSPRLICISKHCSQIVSPNNERKMISYPTCQDSSFLSGVIQEALQDPRITQCEVVDNQTGECTQCKCSWKQHMHITYEYHTNSNYHNMGNSNNRNKDNQSLISSIDQHVQNLQDEQMKIEDAYKKLSKFLHINAIHPFNDDILYYLQLFSLEEQKKREAGVRNDDVIGGLSKIIKNYENDIDTFKETLSNGKDSTNMTDILTADEVFSLVGSLYRLPINGQQIREQINVLKMSEDKAVQRMENYVKLPKKAASSKIMLILTDIVSSTKF